jgi:hypothetical protein
MKTTFAYVCAALMAGLLMGVTASTHAQEARGDRVDGKAMEFDGVIRARDYTSSYKMPFNVGVDRSYTNIDRIDERRTRIHVSDLYGPLVNVTAHGEGVVLWFQDGEEVIRNAVIKNVTGELIHIERVPAKQISITYR